MTVVLAMLTGAFVAVNRSQNDLLGNAAGEDASLRVLESAVSYARMRLEGDQVWGIPTGSDSAMQKVVDTPSLMVWEGEESSVFKVVGIAPKESAQFHFYFQAPGQDFESFYGYDPTSVMKNPNSAASWTSTDGDLTRVSVNNLAGSNSSLTAPQVALRDVPVRSANLLAIGFSGRQLSVADVSLRKKFFVDSSLASEGDIGIAVASPGKWLIESVDPFSNRVTANKRILAPESDSSSALVQFGDGSLEGAGSANAAETILIGGTLSAGVNSITGEVTVDAIGATDLGDGTNDEAETAAADSAAKGNFKPNSAANTDIPELTADSLNSPSGTSFSIQSGRYHFVAEDTVHYYSNPNTDPTSGATPDQTFVGSIQDSAGNDAVRLSGGKFIVADGTDVTITGTSTVSGDMVPYVALGYDSTGGAPTESSLGMLRVEGDLKVEGSVLGSGSLVTTAEGNAEGGLTLQGKSALVAPTDVGVALFSEGPIRMNPVDPRVSTVSDPGELTWKLYQHALSPFGTDFDSWSSLTGQQQIDLIRQGEPSGLEHLTADNLIEDVKNAYPGLPQEAYDIFDQELASGAVYNAALDGTEFDCIIGLREFLKEVQSGVPPQTAQANWLGDQEAKTHLVIQNDLTQLTDGAEADGTPLSDYMLQSYSEVSSTTTSPGVASALDAEFKGLVYTKSDLYAEMDGHSFKLDGALITKGGNLVVDNANQVISRFNPDYMERFLKQTNGGTVPMEVIHWSYR